MSPALFNINYPGMSTYGLCAWTSTYPSWIFTNISHPEKIENIIGRLWKRFGREDLVLSSILLANLPDKEIDINWKWITLAELITHVEKKRGRIP